MMKRITLGAALVMAACAPIPPTADEAPASTVTALELTLMPVHDDAAGEFVSLGVSMTFDNLAVAPSEPVLRLPLVTSNVDTVATVLTDLRVRDSAGAVMLSAADLDQPVTSAGDAVAGGESREWYADRPLQGPVTVTYSVPAHASLPPRGPAPPFSFSNDGLGVSGAGHIFLLLPPEAGPFDTQIRWDMSAAPAGTVGVTSLGGGDVHPEQPLEARELRMGFYMAGAIQTWPDPLPSSGFFGALQGNPPFDGQDLLAWTGELYGHYEVFFGQTDAPPYGVFLRENPVNAGGGVGLHRSFVTTFGQERGNDPEAIKLTLAHEMFHTFQPFLSEPGGLESSWFSEGLASFYQSRLPLRYGMTSPERVLEDINFHAGRYYTSIMAEAPNSLVPERFWADTRIRTLPYDRGMLYFATVDHAVRTRSDGARSLDDLMLAMLDRSQAEGGASNANWEAVLEAELGPEAVSDFRAVLEGARPLPATDAFGPCFTRTQRPMRRYELGFDTAVLAEPVRIVRGLEAGSAAEAAGLRNGDRILQPVPQDHLQGSQDMTLTLEIARGDETLTLTYLPRGETVQAWQWERVEGVPDSACAL